MNRRFDARICWFDDTSHLRTDIPYQLKHTTRWVAAEIESLHYRLDVDTLHADREAETLEVNEIGRVSIQTASPLFFDTYRLNRTTGSFILVDPGTDLTVAAGMIIGAGGDDSVVTETHGTSPPGRREHHLPPEQALPRGALGGAGDERRDDLDDRAVGLGQVDDRDRDRAHARLRRPVLPSCSTATTCATASTRTSASPRRTATRTCAGSARWRRSSPNRAPWRSSRWSAPTAPSATACGRSTRRPGSRSTRSSSTPRWRSANGATRRASTRRRGPARSKT